MKANLLILMLACEVGAPAPATPGTAAAAEAATVADIAEQAAAVQATAHDLTSLVDESRRQVADGRSTPEAEIEKMRLLMNRLEEQNATLQADIDALEARAREASGDPSPPVPPEKKRR